CRFWVNRSASLTCFRVDSVMIRSCPVFWDTAGIHDLGFVRGGCSDCMKRTRPHSGRGLEPMDTTNLRGQLDELFAPGAAQRAETIRQGLQETLRRASAILIYGSGRTGRMIARALRSAGQTPLGFLDDTPSKQGTNVDGYPVWSPGEARR